MADPTKESRRPVPRSFVSAGGRFAARSGLLSANGWACETKASTTRSAP